MLFVHWSLGLSFSNSFITHFLNSASLYEHVPHRTNLFKLKERTIHVTLPFTLPLNPSAQHAASLWSCCVRDENMFSGKAHLLPSSQLQAATYVCVHSYIYIYIPAILLLSCCVSCSLPHCLLESHLRGAYIIY